MASRTIENEVVEFELDPRKFREGTKETLGLIGKLKASMRFGNAARGFSELERSSKNITFAGMTAGIDSVNTKISAMGVITATVLNRITNSVIDHGKRLFNTALVAPLKDGLAEYETQMNAIQTILANTSHKGTGLEEVQDALDELNTYADLTIYNFTQMTDNIGKFTAAGVDLDVSVQAIKGISNLAAVSGSNAQQAATAQYQLSQAISAGVVKLQDWNSVVNAGMGGEVFQQELIRTARIHGVQIDAIIEKNGSFRNSLQEGWLSSQIMLDTLAKFTGDLSREQLLNIGYTEEQVEEIIKLGKTATDAATKVKTLSQLKDTLAEALASGWSQSWRIIIGDFEEAKELFTGLSDLFGSIIERSSSSRNELLTAWADIGGRNVLMDALFNSMDNIVNILSSVGMGFRDIFPEATGEQLLRFTANIWRLVNAFSFTKDELYNIRRISRSFAATLDIVKMAAEALLEPFLEMVPGLQSAGKGLFDFLVELSFKAHAFQRFAERTDVFGKGVSNIVGHAKRLVGGVTTLFNTAKESMSGIIPPLNITGDQVSSLFQRFNDFISGIRLSSDFTERFGRIMKGVASFIDIVRMLVLAIVKPLIKMGSSIKVSNDGIMELLATFGDWISTLRELIIENDSFERAVGWIITQGGALKDAIVGFAEALYVAAENTKTLKERFLNSEVIQKTLELFETFKAEGFTNFVSSAKEGIEGLTTALNDLTGATEEVGEASESALDEDVVKGFAEGAEKYILGFLDILIHAAGNIDFAALSGIIATAMGAMLLKAFRSVLSGNWLSDILDKFIGSGSSVVTNLNETLDVIRGSFVDTFGVIQTNLKADTLLKIAGAVAVVTASIVVLSFLDSERLAKSMAVLGGALLGLFGATGVLGKMNLTGTFQASASIIALSIGLLLLAKAMASVSALNSDVIATALIAIGVGLSEMLLALKVVQGGGDVALLKQAISIQALGLALATLAEVVLAFSGIPLKDLKQGLTAAGLALLELGIAIRIMGAGNNVGLISASVAMVIISGALIVLSEAVKRFGSIPYNELTTGLASIGVALLGIALFTKIVDSKAMVTSAIGLTLMAVAIKFIGDSIVQLGALSWDSLARGLAGLAGALLILAIAANLMNGAAIGAASMVLVAGATFILAEALNAIGDLGWDKLLVALAGLAGFFVVLGLAALILAPVIPALVLLAGVIALIGAGALLFGAGLLIASTGLVALAVSATLIGAAIGIIATAIIKLLPKLAESIGEAMVAFITAISDSSEDIFNAGTNLILTLIRSFTESIPQIVEAAFKLLSAILLTIAEEVPTFIQAGFDILLAFLGGIEENIQEVIDTALGIVTEFIKGLEKGIPDLIDAAFSFILTFIDAMADAVEYYMPDIIERTGELGVAMVDALIKAMNEGTGRIAEAAADLFWSAWDSFKDAAGISSPSKVIYKLARWIPRAIQKAFGDEESGIEKSSRSMVKSAQNGINLLIDTINRGLDDEQMFAPVVTPVLDMTSVQASLRSNRNLLNGNALAVNVAERTRAHERRLASSDISTDGSRDVGDVYFEQHNHSPKALSTLEIYRKTESQVSKLKDRRGVNS